MSKIRHEAASALSTPPRIVRVTKLLPVPDLPNTPDERSTKRFRSRLTLTSSMSSGEPMWKCVESSSPKIASTSSADASYTTEKCAGMVLTGLGVLAPSSSSSIGATLTRPKASSRA